MKKYIHSIVTAFVGLALLATSASSQTAPATPHLQKQGNATQLVVDGKPFLALAAELHNSSASTIGRAGAAGECFHWGNSFPRRSLFGRRAPLERGEGRLRRVVGVFLRSSDDAFLHRQLLPAAWISHCDMARRPEPPRERRVIYVCFPFPRCLSCVFIDAPTRRAIKDEFAARSVSLCSFLVSFPVVMSCLLCRGGPLNCHGVL